MKSYVVERLCFLKTTFVSGKDALLRAGSGSWSSAKALLPVLLRGILSDFSSDNGVATTPPCATALCRAAHRGIALHADIDGGSAVSSATDRTAAAASPPRGRRRGGLALDISVQPIRRDCSATVDWPGLAAVARRGEARGWEADEHAVHTCAPISSQLFIKGRS